MSSGIIGRLLDKFYSREGIQVTILGLDYGGKTTLLYLLRLGTIVQTIPTIGFNIETVDIPTRSGKSFKMQGWDVGTGCGIRYLYGIMSVYLEKSEAMVWVVDGNDKERLSESVEVLDKILTSMKADDYQDTIRKNFPVLILLNKTDLPGSMELDAVRIAFAKVTSGRLVSVFKTSMIKSNLDQTGIPEAFEWLQIAIDISKAKSPALPTPMAEPETILNTRSQATLAQKLSSWLARFENDVGDEIFIEQFNSYNLPEWDHYTHIRIAYVLLTKYGRKEGKDLIFKGLEDYIVNSSQTKGRAFHVTMTYFWIQIVHFGIRNMPPRIHTSKEPQTEERLQSDEFSRFLLINPYVVDGGMWTDYYNKDVMMSAKAKGEMVLPDKKPLPNLVIRDAITTFGTKAR